MIGATRTLHDLSASRSLVSDSFSFATAPRSPALISGTVVWFFPCSSTRLPSRSAVSRVTLCTVESDLSVPDITRNIVMRPANGSATVFQTNAASGAESAALSGAASPPSASTTAKSRSAGDGTYATMASISGCRPMFVVADEHSTREDAPGGDAALESRHQLLLRERAGVEELLHQRVVGFGDHLDERLARAVGRSLPPPPARLLRSALPLPSAG